MEALSTYLPQDRLQALAQGKTLPDRSTGAVLSADISGFTPLTEAFVQQYGPRLGAEELIKLLNIVYSGLIDPVHRYRGSVISFSGDAITCWFDGDDGRRAIASGLKMQAVLPSLSGIINRAGKVPDSFSLALKVAVAIGPVRRFLVGDPEVHYLEALAGNVMERLGQVEEKAGPGEVVVSPEVAGSLGDSLIIERWLEFEGAGPAKKLAVVSGLAGPVESSGWPGLPESAGLSPNRLRPWVLPAVYEWIVAGQGDFMAELRPVVALFLRFKGLDYDREEGVGEILNAFVGWVQKTVAHFGGNLLDLTFDDKGSYLYAVFGAPLALENATARAIRAGLQLVHPPAEFSWLSGVQIGISQGIMRTGAYGGAVRRTYGVLGDEVNLAARLMQKALPGQILVSSRAYRSSGDQFLWQELEDVRVKGKTGSVSVYQPLREIQNSRNQLPTLVGRENERALLAESLQDLVKNNFGRVVIIQGEAGIGKSRLVEDLVQQARTHQIKCLSGSADVIEQNVPYHAWREIFTTSFGLDRYKTPSERTGQVLDLLKFDLNLLGLAPLLNAVLPLNIEPTELTAVLQGKERAQKTTELLAGLLARLGSGRAGDGSSRPLVIILDDAQWLDSASWGLAELINRKLAPLLLVLVMRPPVEPFPIEYTRLAQQPSTRRLKLENLRKDEIIQLVCQRLGTSELPREVVELVEEKAQGNPFFSEELAYSLRDSGVIKIENGRSYLASGEFDFKKVEFPDTVQGVITSRIDRLSPAQQLVLKVSSVIGRTFAFRLLQTIYPVPAERPQLPVHLQRLEDLDITPLERPEPDLTYIFKHIITQEVAYSLMLFSQRQDLHRVVAEWYEQTYADRPAPLNLWLGLLSNHYYQAQVWDRAFKYLTQAGDAATNLYTFPEAGRYYAQALKALAHLPLNEANRRSYVDVTFKHIQVSILFDDPQKTIGRLKELETFLEALPGPDGKPGADKVRLARMHYLLGRAYFLSNRFPEAVEYYRRVLAVGAELEDEELLAIPSDYVGRLLQIQGHNREAESLLATALAWWEKTGNWADWITSNLFRGAAIAIQGRYRPGLEIMRASLARAKEINSETTQVLSYVLIAASTLLAGEYEAALEAAKMADRLARQFDLPIHTCVNLLNMTWSYARLGRPEEVARLVPQVNEMVAKLKGQVVMADRWLSVRAEIAYNSGEYETAIKLAQEALEAARLSQNIATEADAHFIMGKALLKLNPQDRAAAEVHLSKALELNEAGPALFDVARVRIAWALDCYDRGEKAKAAKLLEEALPAYREAGLDESLDLPHKVLQELGLKIK